MFAYPIYAHIVWESNNTMVRYNRLFMRNRKFVWAFASLLEQSKIIEEKGRKIVVKDYKKPGAVFKWNLLYLPPISVYYPLTNDPLERMLREEKFFRNPPKGVIVPRIITMDYRNMIMKREVLEGREPDLSLPDNLYKIGKTLGLTHKGEYCMGDTRPQNFLIMNNSVGIIDAEQSLSNCNDIEYRMWDLLVFIFFLYLDDPLQELQLFGDKIGSFIKGYVNEGLFLNWKAMKQLHPLLLVFPLPYLQVIKKRMIYFSIE